MRKAEGAELQRYNGTSPLIPGHGSPPGVVVSGGSTQQRTPGLLRACVLAPSTTWNAPTANHAPLLSDGGQTDPRDAEPAGLPVKTLGGELMYDKEAGGKGRQQAGQQKREKEMEEALAAAAAIQVSAG